MDLTAVSFHARRLDCIVRKEYPAEFRTSAEIEAIRQLSRLVDRKGGELLMDMEAMLHPAMKRLRALGADTSMHRTVFGTSDDIKLEVGFGGLGKYTFEVGPFYYERIFAVLILRILEPDGRPGFGGKIGTFIGGLADVGDEPTWLHIPEEAWRAAPRPHLVDFNGLRPIETVIVPLLDELVRRAIRYQVSWRRRHGFPVHRSEVAAYRRDRLLGRYRQPGA